MCEKTDHSPKRVWIYSRIAHDKQGESELEKQKENLIAYAKEKGFKIVGTSEDVGSGLDYDRKGIKEVIEATQSKNVDVVLIKSLYCIGRDLFKTYEVLELLKSNGIVIISPMEGEIQIPTMLHNLAVLIEEMEPEKTFDAEDLLEQDEFDLEDAENLQ